MAELHARKAQQLAAIIDEMAWPGRALVGDEGSAGAWRVLPAACGSGVGGRPRGLRRPQRNGTQFDWDARVG